MEPTIPIPRKLGSSAENQRLSKLEFNVQLSEGVVGQYKAILSANEVSHPTGYGITRSSNPLTLKNNPACKETRKDHNQIPREQISEMETILKNEGLSGCSPTWM